MQHLNPARRHDFMLLADVVDGNMNGDPDGGNLPRTDPESLQGLATDVCLKRKIRNYVTIASDHSIRAWHSTPNTSERMTLSARRSREPSASNAITLASGCASTSGTSVCSERL